MPPRSPGSFFAVQHCVCPRFGRCRNNGCGRNHTERRDHTDGRNGTAAGQMVGGGKACLAGSYNYDVGLYVLIVLASGSLLGGGQTFFTTPDLSCIGPTPSTLGMQGKAAVLHSPCHPSPAPGGCMLRSMSTGSKKTATRSIRQRKSARPKGCPWFQRIFGGAEGTRTPDPLHAMQVRYQLRHSPEHRPRKELFLAEAVRPA